MQQMEIEMGPAKKAEEDGDSQIYAEDVDIQFNEETADGFPAPSDMSVGPVTIYRLVKLEHAEALGISLREGSVTTPNDSTKIITRNIIKLKKPPKNMVLAQKNFEPTSSMNAEERDNSFYKPYIKEDTNAYNTLRRFACTLCNKGFRHISHLKRHINSHTGEKTYDCDACGKKFLDASTLCRHRKTHTGERPYVCKICQKCFGTLGSLRRHVTVHNQQSRPYSCSVCSKRFPDHSSFQKHMLIHTGVKPFECDVCRKAFVHVGDLNGHKKVHEEVKPFKCDRCDQQFSKQSNCARHALIHEGDKDFACHLCGVGYNFQSSLTRHLLTHRKQGYIKRRYGKHKVVILAEFDRKHRQPIEKHEPHRLLKQMKSLFGHKNKVTFGNSTDEVGVTGVGNTSEEVSSSEDSCGEDKGTDEEDVDYKEENYKNEQHTEISTEYTDEISNVDISNRQETIIIKQIIEDGDVKYIIEEA